ncbi:Class V chitinase-like protein [Drosera capensis]
MESTNTNIFLILFVFLVLRPPVTAAQPTVKAAYWFPESGYPLTSINSTLFTHLFYAFAAINSTTNQPYIPQQDQTYATQFTATLLHKNPAIKTLLSIGGGSANPAAFSAMANSNSTRKTFITSSISLARSLNFSGLDLDWEYPQNQSDMSNYGSLLTEWRSAIVSESKSSGKPLLQLTAAVNFSPYVNGLTYPVNSVALNLDWINLMAYDFYAPDWSPPKTEPQAALNDPSGQASGTLGVTTWVNTGLPAKKIALGLPFYGYAWKLTNPNNHGYLAPTSGAAVSSDGSMTYGDIKGFISQNAAATVYNSTVVESYCYSGTTWITYDDPQAISAKVGYVKQARLIGYFAWHVGADDSNSSLAKTAFQT